MVKVNPRKTMEQVLDINQEYEIHPDHVNDWHYCTSAAVFQAIKKDLGPTRIGMFNISAAISSPKSIRYRQMTSDFDHGKAGDYLFVDKSGGMMGVPYIIFKRLF